MTGIKKMREFPSIRTGFLRGYVGAWLHAALITTTIKILPRIPFSWNFFNFPLLISITSITTRLKTPISTLHTNYHPYPIIPQDLIIIVVT